MLNPLVQFKYVTFIFYTLTIKLKLGIGWKSENML